MPAGKQRIHRYETSEDLPVTSAGLVRSVNTLGMENGSLSVESANAGGSPSLVVKVFGSNEPTNVRSLGEGEELASLTLNAAGKDSVAWANKAYALIYIEVTDATDLELAAYGYHLSGSPVSA